MVGGDESGTLVGKPTIEGALVRAKVSGNFRSRKIIVFKYKNKTRYRRFNTHRQDLTRLVIKEIISSAAPTDVAAETPQSSRWLTKPSRRRRPRQLFRSPSEPKDRTSTNE